MADQLLTRSRVAPSKQRTDSNDFNAANESAFGNLALALRFLLAPNFGIVRGGDLVPTEPPTLQCTLQPLGGLGTNGAGAGLIIVESDRVQTFQPNASGNPRIDLVSIRYAEANGNAQLRWFRNDDSTWNHQSTPTQILANPVVTITQGQPAANPVAPVTPAGDIALFEVRVESGNNQITAGRITRVETDRVDPLRVGVGAGAVNFALPWTSGELLRLATPALMRTFFVGAVDLQPGSLNNPTPLELAIRDLDSGFQPGTRNFVVQAPGAGAVTSLFVLGWYPGPTGTAPGYADKVRRYGLRLRRQDGAGGQTDATTSNCMLAALTM